MTPLNSLDVVKSSGRSMRPLIRDGSLIRVKPTQPEKLTPGDIIVFRDEGRLIAHRLIEKKGGDGQIRLRQKGDNQLVPSWIRPKSLVGKAVFLSCEQNGRFLDVDARLLRIRIMTFCSRVEANVSDAYLDIRPPVRAVIKWLLVPFVIAAWPVRRFLYTLLLTAYPREVRPDSEETLPFLLSCFRGNGVPVIPVQDWPRVLETGGRHGLIPLASLVISRAGASPDVLDAFKRYSYRAALMHQSALSVLSELNRMFHDVELDYAILKGAHLYEALYKDLFPRDYEDIDLLVRPRDVDRALSRLGAAGYEVVGGRIAQSLLRHGHFHLSLDSSKPGRPRIELHWSLVDRANLYRIPDDEILSRAIDFKVGHITFKVLSAEDTLIYLCLHAAKHGVLNHLGLQQGYPPEWFAKRITGNRLLWFMDIQLLLKKEWANLDWTAVTRRMNQWNVVVEVAECLHVLRVLNAESAASHALEKIGLSNVHGAKSGWISSVLFGSRAGRCLLENVMRMNPALLFRPVRILLINRLLFPSSRNLLKFYGVSNSWCAPALYVIHPFVLLLRLFGRPRP